MAEPDRPRLAVMGAGMIGRRHIDIVTASAGCELAAVVEPAWSGDAPCAPLYPDLDSMLKETKPDGVIIATPTAMHKEHVLACLGHGLPALVEKPVAADMEQAHEMEQAVAKSSVPVLVGHVRRHSGVIAAAKKALEKGALGDVVAMSAVWCLHKPPSYFDDAWRMGDGGGPVLTNVSHDIDLMRYLMGEIAQVQAMATRSRRDGHDLEDTAAILFRFESGALGSMVASDIGTSPWSWEFSFPDKTSYDHTKTGQDCYRLVGTKAALGLPSMTLWHHDGEPSWLKPIHFEQIQASEKASAMELQLEHFLAVVRGDAKPLSTVHDAAKTLQVTLQVLEGARQG